MPPMFNLKMKDKFSKKKRNHFYYFKLENLNEYPKFYHRRPQKSAVTCKFLKHRQRGLSKMFAVFHQNIIDDKCDK